MALALGITSAAIPLASSAQSVQELQQRALERQRMEDEHRREAADTLARIEARFEAVAASLILAHVKQGLKLRVLGEDDLFNYTILSGTVIRWRDGVSWYGGPMKEPVWSHRAGKTIGSVHFGGRMENGGIALFFFPVGGRWVDLRLQDYRVDPTRESGCTAKITAGAAGQGRRERAELEYTFPCKTDVFAERKNEISAALESALKAAFPK